MRSDHDLRNEMRNDDDRNDRNRDEGRNEGRMRGYGDENRMRGENREEGRMRGESRARDDDRMHDEGYGYGGEGSRYRQQGRGGGGYGDESGRFGNEGSRFGGQSYGNPAYGTSPGYGDAYGSGYGYGDASRYGQDVRFGGGNRYDANVRYDAYRAESDRYMDYDEDQGGGSGRGWMMAAAAAAVAAVGGYALFRSARGDKHDRQGRSRWRGIHVEESITIDKPASEIYRHWSKLENLPSIMSHVKKVEDLGDGRTRWTADAPAGQTVTWEAETIQDIENQRLTWRSVPGADVPNEGSVSFQERSGDRGTEVHVTLMYHPPGGALASGLATLFGKEPSQQVKEDLRRFKQKMEAGEIVGDAHKQPSGRSGGKG